MKKNRIYIECFFVAIAILMINYYIWNTTGPVTASEKVGDILVIILENLIAVYCIVKHHYKILNFKYSSLFVGGFIGLTLAISIVGLDALNPQNIDWIMIELDRRQHFLGWNFFSKDSWHFPLGFFDNWATPNGMSVMFTDSVSIAAIFFKVFSGILPDTFQYLGLWLYLSFIIMGAFISFIFDKVTEDIRVKAMISIFFVLTPIMLSRVEGHTSLTSQWLILWALYLLIRGEYERRQLLSWCGLLSLCVLIHPYFLFMNYVIFVVYLFKGIVLDKEIGIKKVIGRLIATVATVLLTMFIVGYFKVNASEEIIGLGEYSMNLNAFINPMKNSSIISAMPMFEEQYEGFAYLGLGGILVVILGFISFIKNGFNRTNKNLYLSLVFISLILTILALSNKLTLGNHVIWEFSVGGSVEKLWGTIRATGRMIWPVWYIMTIFAFMKVIRTNKNMAGILISIILAIQILDISKMCMKIRNEFICVEKWESPLQNEFWNKAKSQYKQVSFIHKIEDYGPLAYFASMNGLNMDYGYFARDPKQLKQYLENNKKDLLSGNFKEDNLYVLNQDKATVFALLDGNYKDLIKEIDGYILFSPKGF